MDKLTVVQQATDYLNGVKTTMTVAASNVGAITASGTGFRAKAGWRGRGRVRIGVTAYGTSLIMVGVMMPFVSSVLVVGLYLAHPNMAISLSPLLYLDPQA